MDVFVYGTLTDPETVGGLVDSYAFVGAAVLEGLHPVTGEYPSLAPGDETGGRLLRTAELDELDAYEGVEDGLYVRMTVPKFDPHGEQQAEVAVYVGNHEQLGVVEDVSWPGEGSLEERVERYVREEGVVVRERRS
ncbi:AIG2 family protein [halophilic archaeon DL31]|jgi:gamma-glutamylcyclotransferase (GGCT)/AIG2-like uncharacterized protein YtfP|nr:AIG2 family protein [halophilic archaeon DL31]